MNFPLIFHIAGSVVIIVAIFMLAPLGISVFSAQPDLNAFVISVSLTLICGLLMYFPTRKHKGTSIRHRDVFVVVTFTWLSVIFFGSLPYMLSSSLDSLTDAFFEAVAGFTTTGASVVTDIESLPMGILFWRSLTQWLGGMGIILFALAVLPFIGTGGMQLFKAEVPELTVDRLKPRIIDTAKALWYIYAALTLLAVILFKAGGMSLFDAVCHGLTTLATGGFSTKNASMAHFQSPFIEWVCTIFMLMAGINYSLYFYALRGNLRRFWESSEFRFYSGVVLVSVALISLRNYGTVYNGLTDSLRYAAFQVASIMTTTGYATADYEVWAPFSQMLLVVLMFFGGMIGSTGGGMKQVRVLLMLKQGYRELYQLIHPRAVTSLKLDSKHVTKEILGSIWGFLFLFVFSCVVGTLMLTALGIDMVTASSTVVSAMSNVGPALGNAGPTENYAGFPAAGKWILALCMIIGRLEIYTVIILFTPGFWKK
jgi:trk system potassium uptake protein TrkH